MLHPTVSCGLWLRFASTTRRRHVSIQSNPPTRASFSPDLLRHRRPMPSNPGSPSCWKTFLDVVGSGSMALGPELPVGIVLQLQTPVGQVPSNPVSLECIANHAIGSDAFGQIITVHDCDPSFRRLSPSGSRTTRFILQLCGRGSRLPPVRSAAHLSIPVQVDDAQRLWISDHIATVVQRNGGVDSVGPRAAPCS